MGTKYQDYDRTELELMLLKMDDIQEYYVGYKLSAEIKMNEQEEIINELRKENEALKKTIQKLSTKRDKKGRPSVEPDVIARIKELKDCGYTTREIAKKLNISLGVVSKYNPYYQKRKFD